MKFVQFQCLLIFVQKKKLVLNELHLVPPLHNLSLLFDLAGAEWCKLQAFSRSKHAISKGMGGELGGSGHEFH